MNRRSLVCLLTSKDVGPQDKILGRSESGDARRVPRDQHEPHDLNLTATKNRKCSNELAHRSGILIEHAFHTSLNDDV